MVAVGGCGGSGPSAETGGRAGPLDLESRAAQLVALPVTLPSLEAASRLDRQFARPGTAGTPGALWLEAADPQAVASLAATSRAWPVAPLIVAEVGRRLDPAVAGATLSLPTGSVLDPRGAAALPGRAELLADEMSILGIDLGIVTVHTPPPGVPTTVPDIDGTALGLGELLRVTESAGVALGAAVTADTPNTPDTAVTTDMADSPDTEDGPDTAVTANTADSPDTAEGTDTAVTADTAETPAPIWNPGRFAAFERPLLEAATSAGARALLLDGLSIPELDRDWKAAGPATVDGVLRRDLGWEGVVIVDLRRMEGRTLAGEAAIRAIAAGADLVIIPDDATEVVRSIADAVRSGRLPAARVEEAAHRLHALKRPLVQRRSPVAASRATASLANLDRPRLPAPAPPPAEAAQLGPPLVVREPAEVGLSEQGLEAADRAIREAIEDSVFTAAALAVGRRGGLVRMRGFGALPDGGDVDPAATLFDLASLTKVVGTTTAAGILLDAGRLDLDAAVASYLPEFDGEGKDHVTVRHLLSHTSGLPSGLWLYGSADSEAEALSQVLHQPLIRPPGDEAEYSDLGMILLAAVIERVAGMPLDDFLVRNLFVPLGMAHTHYLPPALLHDGTAPTTASETERPYPLRGVVHDANAFRLGGVAGHAGLFSTARDVAVFAQMILNGGVYGPAEILADSTVHELTREQPGTEGRALGWDTPDDRSSAGRYFSSASFGHTGYTGTSLWIDPARDLFVVLLTNRTYTGASAGDILDLRITVHEAVARSVTDEPITRRPGSR